LRLTVFLKVFEVFKYHVQYLKVFKYLVQYLIFKYYLNTAQSEVFHKVFKYSGQSICPNTACNQFGDRCFATAGPMLWSSLPKQLRQPDITFGQFKQSLKTFMLGQQGRGVD